MAHARLAATANEVQTLKQSIWTILALLPLGALAAEVYVSVGADGQVIYSDRPTGTEAEEVLEIRSGPRAAATQPVRSAAAAEPAEAAAPASDAPLVAEVRREATPEERAANCAIVRQRSDSYSAAYRIYRDEPNGERHYLTAEEIDEARAAVAAEVAEWCDPV